MGNGTRCCLTRLGMRSAVYANVQARGKPYVIVFCGVNGVGKSTNLAKIAYWLGGHGIKVMIAACDTFRAGASWQRARVLRGTAQNSGLARYEGICRSNAIRRVVPPLLAGVMSWNKKGATREPQAP